MIEARVESSHKVYRPGQNLNAVITISNPGILLSSGRRRSRDHMLDSSPSRSRGHSRASSREAQNSTIELDLKHINSTNSAFSQHPMSPTSPPSTPAHTNGHSRTRSITFETAAIPARTRRASRSTSISQPAVKIPEITAENLLIVYLQVLGTFSTDPSYVTEDSFNKLKGQGANNATGGVVANSTVTEPRWSFGSWTNVLRGSQPSSIADLRHAAATKTLPILSMPPAILEVNVSLKAGECVRKTITMALPKWLPPSYIGKTMQISYSIKLSAQRDDNSTTTFECPIQIYPCSDDKYNFLQPHLLKNTLFQISPFVVAKKEPKSISTKEDFTTFLNALKDPTLNLPSPIIERKHFWPVNGSNDGHTKDLGLRFDISRGEGEQVCNVTMPRSRHCSGGVIAGTIDFRDNQLHCFQCTVVLESQESIDAQYVATSPDKISQDSTRKLGSDRLMTTCAIESDFEVSIPDDITPSFQTMPLALEYSLLFQFILHDQSSLIVESRTKHGIESRPIQHVDGQAFECRVPITIIAPESNSSIPTSKWGEL